MLSITVALNYEQIKKDPQRIRKLNLLLTNLVKDNKILKHNPGEKSTKVPFIIYADF